MDAIQTLIAQMLRTPAFRYSQVPPSLKQMTYLKGRKNNLSKSKPRILNQIRLAILDCPFMKHGIRGWEHFVNDPRIVEPVYLIYRFRILIFDCLSLSLTETHRPIVLVEAFLRTTIRLGCSSRDVILCIHYLVSLDIRNQIKCVIT
jgi:hypothetical protein